MTGNSSLNVQEWTAERLRDDQSANARHELFRRLGVARDQIDRLQKALDVSEAEVERLRQHRLSLVDLNVKRCRERDEARAEAERLRRQRDEAVGLLREVSFTAVSDVWFPQRNDLIAEIDKETKQ